MSKDEPRILVLEEQVKSLSDELMQCQVCITEFTLNKNEMISIID